ncbi:MAG: hypothetical protein E3J86_12770 [Candidatus Thorarchaeota archaeon]|jgi:hypothetical protein|nr:MAG: hypothetical protein E3J86_12770 [Candidatus Thorarchaeota archaeon]
MTKEAIVTELASIIDSIEETRTRLGMDYDKFQIALTNTLRLLSDTSPTLVRLKGDTEDLKGYLVKTSTEIRQTVLQPFDQIKTRMEKVLGLIKAT